MSTISTPITRLFGVKHPVLLAGMNVAAGPKLAAAVSNAGGLGVIGGVGYSPEMLREQIHELKGFLAKPDLPFGVDLLLPQVGGNARKTNYDYTKGKLDDLINVVIEEKASLFVSAVGIPPRFVVDRLHKAGIPYMNMIGHPKHVHKACEIGADLVCAQGGEAGGHTGEIPTSVLIPACADACRGYTSPLTGKPVQLVAAGGMFDGRSLAAALMYGAGAVWVGTRFVTARESNAPEGGKQAIIEAGFDSFVRTTLWSGRPIRAKASPYLLDWEQNRQAEIKELQSKGIVVLDYELDRLEKAGELTDEIIEQTTQRPMGYGASMVNKKNQTAGEIVLEMTVEAYTIMKRAERYTSSLSKL